MKKLLLIFILIGSLTLTSCKAESPKNDIDENKGENTNIESQEDEGLDDPEEYKPYGG